MSDWKRVALALADAFERLVDSTDEERAEMQVKRVVLQAELNESRAETEDARKRCVELEQELETAREARAILMEELKVYRNQHTTITAGAVRTMGTTGSVEL